MENDKMKYLKTSTDKPRWKVVVELDNGKLAIAQLDYNLNRKCWMIQGMGGLFWRSWFESVENWRWMTADEMVEYHENRTLKIIENDKETEI